MVTSSYRGGVLRVVGLELKEVLVSQIFMDLTHQVKSTRNVVVYGD